MNNIDIVIFFIDVFYNSVVLIEFLMEGDMIFFLKFRNREYMFFCYYICLFIWIVVYKKVDIYGYVFWVLFWF